MSEIATSRHDGRTFRDVVRIASHKFPGLNANRLRPEVALWLQHVGAMGTPARLVAVLAFATSVHAQTPAQPAPQRARPPAPTVTQVVVRDRSGTALNAVHISASGTKSAEATTDAKGGASL